MTEPSIFVSHSHVDDIWCRLFVQALRTAGYDVWYDAKSLRGGASWIETIENELQTRQIFMVIVTPDAWQSYWVRKETQLAIATKRDIVGILHKATEITGFLSLESTMVDATGLDSTSAADKVIVELVQRYGAVESPPAQSLPIDHETSPSHSSNETRRRTVLLSSIVGALLLISMFLFTMSRLVPVKPQTASAATIYGLLYDGSLVAVNASKGTLRWSFQTENDHLFPISTVSNGTIYVPSLNNYLYAISNGKLKWRYKVGSNGADPPLVTGNVVYAILDHSVDALDASKGTFLRRYQVGNDNTFLPRAVQVANGIVYIIVDDYVPEPPPESCGQTGCSGTSASGGSIYAFRASDGSLLWHDHTSNEGYSSLTIVRGIVYTADGASVVALQGNSGKLIWRSQSTGSSPLLSVSNGVVCCSGESDTAGRFISALAANDGHTLWTFPVRGIQYPYLTVLDGVIYLCQCQSTLYTQSLGLQALQLKTGKSLWFFPVNGFLYGYVHVVSNGIAYLSSDEDGGQQSFIDALRIKNGTLAWRLRTTGRTDPVAVGGILYTGIGNPVADPHLYAIKASNGKLVWSYQAKSNVFDVQVG